MCPVIDRRWINLQTLLIISVEMIFILWMPPKSRISIFLSSTWIDVSIEHCKKYTLIGKQSQIEVFGMEVFGIS